MAVFYVTIGKAAQLTRTYRVVAYDKQEAEVRALAQPRDGFVGASSVEDNQDWAVIETAEKEV